MIASVVECTWTRNSSCPLTVTKQLFGIDRHTRSKARQFDFCLLPSFPVHQICPSPRLRRRIPCLCDSATPIELMPYTVGPEVLQESSSNIFCLQTHRGMPRPLPFLFIKDLFSFPAIRLCWSKAFCTCGLWSRVQGQMPKHVF